jgi:hypothetical protein
MISSTAQSGVYDEPDGLRERKEPLLNTVVYIAQVVVAVALSLCVFIALA